MRVARGVVMAAAVALVGIAAATVFWLQTPADDGSVSQERRSSAAGAASDPATEPEPSPDSEPEPEPSPDPEPEPEPGEGFVYESGEAGRVVISAGYPTPATTGLAGLGVDADALPVYEGPNVITEDTTISGQRMGHIEARGAEVTIEGSHMESSHGVAVARTTNGGTLTIKDSRVHQTGEDGRAVVGSQVTIERSHVTGGATVVNLGSGARIEGSFLADPTPNISGAHYDIVQTNNAAGGFTLIDSTVLGRWKAQTSAVFLEGNRRWSGLQDPRVEGNFLSGGNYTMYLSSHEEHGPLSGAVVRDNVWYADSWQYGTHSLRNVGSDLIWENNRTTNGDPIE